MKAVINTMVRHIILWKFNPEVIASEKQDQVLGIIRKSAEGMVGKISGLLSADVSLNFADTPYDFVYCADFISRDALNAYQTNPLHEAHKKLCAPYVTDRLVADYIR